VLCVLDYREYKDGIGEAGTDKDLRCNARTSCRKAGAVTLCHVNKICCLFVSFSSPLTVLIFKLIYNVQHISDTQNVDLYWLFVYGCCRMDYFCL